MRDENEMIDDEGAVRLLEPLRGEPDSRTAIDVPKAMSEGLRRRRSRRWSTAFAALAVTSLTIGGGTLAVSAVRQNAPEPRPAPTVTAAANTTTAPVVAGPARCEVTRLPTAGVKKAVATAGDPSGRWAAGRLYSTSGHPSKTIIWKDGAIHQQLAMPGSDADVVDLNSAGAGVANAFGAGDHQSAYQYKNGHFTKLRGEDIAAIAINDAGVMAGTQGAPEDDSVPVRWPSATATPQKLPLPDKATQGAAEGIAEDGTVVGIAGPDIHTLSGYLWFPDGTGRYLPLPTMRDGRRATSFSPASISNGWVSGNAVYETKDMTAFTPMRYRISTGEYETLSTDVDSGDLVTADGWVVGGGRQSPVMLAGSRTVELPAYGKAGSAPGLIFYDVRAVSADGRVVIGYKAGEDLGNDPLMWTCR